MLSPLWKHLKEHTFFMSKP